VLTRPEGRRFHWSPAIGWRSEKHRIMTTIRTGTGLTRYDVRRLELGRYEILAIETLHLDQGELTEIIWERDDGPDAITEAELPF